MIEVGLLLGIRASDMSQLHASGSDGLEKCWVPGCL